MAAVDNLCRHVWSFGSRCSRCTRDGKYFSLVRAPAGYGCWYGLKWSSAGRDNLASCFWLGCRSDRVERSLFFVWGRRLHSSFASSLVDPA